jgi:hypothetical protein
VPEVSGYSAGTCYALAYEARNAESANLDSTLAKRLMDKGIRLRVFARKQMSRTRATHCPGHCTSASVIEGRRLCRLLAFHPFLRAAQRAFIKADSFLRAAGLICGRLPAFFVAGFRVAACLDPRFRSAHRAFIAAAIRRRAAALIVRFRGPFVSPLFATGNEVWSVGSYTINTQIANSPEPATFLLLGSSLLTLTGVVRRR